jgi:hypothetical protein
MLLNQRTQARCAPLQFDHHFSKGRVRHLINQLAHRLAGKKENGSPAPSEAIRFLELPLQLILI